jgi:L-aminopeptidase/D-esterase-like protein
LAFTHGKDAIFNVTSVGNTPTDLSVYLNDTGLDRTADQAETSTLGSTYKSFVAGLIDGKFNLSGLYDPTADAVLDELFVAGTSTDFYYQPQGAGTGMTNFAGHGILTSYSLSAGLGGPSAFTATFQIDGAVTRTTL